MRVVIPTLVLLCAAVLFAQIVIFPGNGPIVPGAFVIPTSDQGIPKSGLVADYDLTGGADVQSIANGVSGGPALQRGSTSGSDTNDPTPGATGWGFDGTDDYGESSISPGSNLSVIVIAKTTVSSWTGLVRLDSGTNYAGLIVSDSWTVAWTPQEQDNLDTGPIGNGTWFFAAGTASGTTRNLYVNTEASVSKTSNAFTTTKLQIGKGGLSQLNGTIARVLIYNRALSDAEVTKVYTVLKSWGAGKGISLP